MLIEYLIAVDVRCARPQFPTLMKRERFKMPSNVLCADITLTKIHPLLNGRDLKPTDFGCSRLKCTGLECAGLECTGLECTDFEFTHLEFIYLKNRLL